jgi:hypothetical protein
MDRLPILAACVFATLATLQLGCQLGFGDGPVDDDTAADDDDISSLDDDDQADDDDASSDDDDDQADDDDDQADDDDEDPLEGLVYFLDLGSDGFEFTEPAGLGVLLQSQIPRDDGAVFAATNIAGSSIEMLFGAAIVLNPNGNPDDWLWEQTDHDTSEANGSWSGLSFDVGSFEMVIQIDAMDVWFGDGQFSGTYASDGSVVSGARVEFSVDTTPLDDVVGMDICSMATCETCPAGSPNPGVNCLRIVAVNGTCPLLDGLYLVEFP